MFRKMVKTKNPSLPLDVLYHIVKLIDNPKTFRSISRTNSVLFGICQTLQKQKKHEFAKELRFLANDYKHFFEYSILPNGAKIGEHKIWLIDNDLPQPHNRSLVSHFFVTDPPIGCEVKTFWPGENSCNIYQEWFHNPVDKIMTEHKTFKSTGELEYLEYNQPFSNSMFRRDS